MKEKVNVTGVPETMVQTLVCKSKRNKKDKMLKINDEIAVELVKNLDYDFSKADKDKAMNYGVIARTIVLDRMVEQYLEKNANTIVINIACGLDTRCYRMEGKISALVQCGFAGNDEDKETVSYRNRSDISDCKVCNG